MSEIFIVLVCDRHNDVEPIPFTTPEAAIGRARREVEENARHPEVIEWDEPLTEGMIASGWIFNVIYGVEGDSVRVVRRELDPQ